MNCILFGKVKIKVFDTWKVQIGNTRQMRKCTWKLAALEQKGKTTHTVFGMPLVTFTATITGVWLSSDFTVLIPQGLQDRETPSPYLICRKLRHREIGRQAIKGMQLNSHSFQHANAYEVPRYFSEGDHWNHSTFAAILPFQSAPFDRCFSLVSSWILMILRVILTTLGKKKASQMQP